MTQDEINAAFERAFEQVEKFEQQLNRIDGELELLEITAVFDTLDGEVF
jgi:hypothetical protein